jgi:hypothetical protein
MNPRATPDFWSHYNRLPSSIQKSAKRAYARFRQNPNHPSLRLKKVHTTQEIYSVRITEDYRALGVREGDTIVWFWIGSHADYERILGGL